MTQTCNICGHPQRSDIEQDILGRVPQRTIANRYESISQMGVSRHKNNCIPKALSKAREAEDLASADVLLADIATIRGAAFRALDRAEASGDEATLMRAIREARENVRILGELRGELNKVAAQQALISPVAMQVIVNVLSPYPELAERLSDALEPLEELEAGGVDN